MFISEELLTFYLHSLSEEEKNESLILYLSNNSKQSFNSRLKKYKRIIYVFDYNKNESTKYFLLNDKDLEKIINLKHFY